MPVRTLLERIEADAAAQLTLAPDRKPGQELARYRHFLKQEASRLKALHRDGGSGLEICQARAAVVDALLRHLFAAVSNHESLAAHRPFPPLALVAIGGYGRGELNPFSDLDIMFLHDGTAAVRGKTHLLLTALTGESGLIYTLYDVGIKVGHSTRSLEDCVRVANGDMQTKTSLIEARCITGAEAVFKQFQQIVVQKCVKGHEAEYIDQRLADQAARRAKFGNFACMQEPNLKNGCGGLRDYQNLLWMAFFKYRTRSWSDLEQKELVATPERQQLEAAYDFLLRARTDLHFHAGRAVDVLTKGVQPTIAHNLGFTERSPSRRLEQFMREVYTHLRNIDLITRTLEQRLALLPSGKLIPPLKEFLRNRRHRAQYAVDGFKMLDGEVHAASPRVFRDQPRRMMRAFLHAQQRGLRLSADLVRLIRSQLALVDDAFRADPHVHESFLEILNQRGNVAGVVRTMHEVGFLGKFITEFEPMTCLVQHEFYHQYTADEHTLVCLAKLDEIWGSKTPPLSQYSELFQSLERPNLLYLALLLHDIGKGAGGGDHTEVGADIAQKVARRLRLDAATTEQLCFLVENHLLMAQISQRRDLDDLEVIRQFAARVRSPQLLAMLTLHTLADSRGTSENFWNGFKDTLLWQLFHRAHTILTGGADFVRAAERQRELLALEVRRLAGDISDEELHAHFTSLPARYFVVRSGREIVADLGLVNRFIHQVMESDEHPLKPVVDWHNDPDRGYTTVSLCTWDRAGLFSKVAGSLSAAGLNIHSAQIFTRTDGIILDTFLVTDARNGQLASRDEREKFEQIVTSALTTGLDLAPLIARRKGRPALYQSVEGERMPTLVRFINELASTRTILDLESEDRVGLLFAVSQSLSDLNVDISLAKVCTEKGAAMDTFYLTELDHSKIDTPERLKLIEARLRTAVAALDH